MRLPGPKFGHLVVRKVGSAFASLKRLVIWTMLALRPRGLRTRHCFSLRLWLHCYIAWAANQFTSNFQSQGTRKLLTMTKYISHKYVYIYIINMYEYVCNYILYAMWFTQQELEARRFVRQPKLPVESVLTERSTMGPLDRIPSESRVCQKEGAYRSFTCHHDNDTTTYVVTTTEIEHPIGLCLWIFFQ